VNGHAREIVELAQQLGFTVDHVTGSGHIRLVSPKGSVTMASTPSEYRGRANTIAMLERVSGNKLPRVKHRRSRKAVKGSGFTLALAKAEQTQWHKGSCGKTVDDLTATRDRLIQRCHALAADRGTIRSIPEVLDVIAHVEDQLRALHQPVQAFDPFTLRH